MFKSTNTAYSDCPEKLMGATDLLMDNCVCKTANNFAISVTMKIGNRVCIPFRPVQDFFPSLTSFGDRGFSLMLPRLASNCCVTKDGLKLLILLILLLPPPAALFTGGHY